MAWPIAEVARMSGVTARTLRHYDEIGLLPPARIGSNGHRYYEERELLRLQQILVLRALGLGLSEIGRVLAAQVDELEALRGHHRAFPELAGDIERRTSAMSEAETEAGHRKRTAQMIRLAELLAAGTPADAVPAQAEIDAQYRALAELRAVSAQEYRAIGRACVDNEQWRAAYETIAPGLAEYQRDAIEAYAASRMS
ncbi:MerR family transcriptional regulator [Streptomyces sp. WAC01526]|uniref:MerR family transcriptional regulator n=1 Tax=Streptomyces sp. WAC01526 TaxID=2588709 RepID=UPI0011DF0893|nr:MerR family transcriptional regulator [Streptomyces sp. WAC01526]